MIKIISEKKRSNIFLTKEAGRKIFPYYKNTLFYIKNELILFIIIKDKKI